MYVMESVIFANVADVAVHSDAGSVMMMMIT